MDNDVKNKKYIDPEITEYANFNWKNYIENYDDLNHIETKEEAWEHWINHGKNEGRLYKKKVKKKLFDF